MIKDIFVRYRVFSLLLPLLFRRRRKKSKAFFPMIKIKKMRTWRTNKTNKRQTNKTKQTKIKERKVGTKSALYTCNITTKN